jgi:F-type H+-transporting ATPase subunit delta
LFAVGGAGAGQPPGAWRNRETHKEDARVASPTSGLAGRYASALYELAEAAKALDEVAADLTALRHLIAESADLARLVRSPVIGRDAQAKAMAAVLEQAGAHELTKKLVGTVTMNRRLFTLSDIAKAFLVQLAERRGETTADVTSATILSKEQLAAVTDALKGVIGQKVAINPIVDPSIIGGLVVRVGSRMFDSSLRTKLQRLQIAMKGTG